jgi:glycine dehydrogenase subunit 1
MLCKIPNVSLAHGGPFFHEFVTRLPMPPQAVEAALEAHGILSGLPVAGGMLWCVTEKPTLAQLKLVAEIVGEVCAK